MAIPPNKTDSRLIVDANGVLPFPVAPQSFQPIPRRRCQHAQFRGSVQLQQFAERNAPEGSKAPRMLVVKKLLGFLRREALDHMPRVLRRALYVKRWIAKNSYSLASVPAGE